MKKIFVLFVLAISFSAAHAFIGNDKVINKNQLNDFQKILTKYSDTFSYFEVVNETYGNFKHIKHQTKA